MGYIKSHSNYVIKKNHQLVNDGKIYERDITTIGGLNQFAKGQVPIYQSGNFIITINNDSSFTKDYTNNNWEKNSNDEVWTLTNLSNTTNDEKDTFEVLKQDYYSLRDFAYYGSCSELIRASITDIINRFPGEMYGPIMGKNENGENFGINMFYTDEYGNESILYNTKWYLLDNPFNIDIYAKEISKNDDTDELKYFCNGGYENYLMFKNDEFDEINDVITNWDVIRYDCDNPFIYKNGKDDDDELYYVKAEVTIGNKNNKITIFVVKGDNDSIVYLTNSDGLGYHIRPKNIFYENFIKSLDSFQSILLNTNSKPKYSVLFEIIRENSFGYYTELKRFTFPITFGNYNLSINDPAYSTYINDLVDIANYYDENFCDNLYRSMCHEAIKNFDWSYTREYNDGDSEEYIFGGTRMQNVLRLIGREFDEIKFYIDNIANANTLSYNNSDNMPNNMLNKALINDGWDVINITPFKKNENGEFVKDNELLIYPYSNKNVCCPNGYFINFQKIDCTTETENKCCKNEQYDGCCYDVEYECCDDDKMYMVSNGVLKTKIKEFFSDAKYTMNDVNNLFMKILRLNSRQIYRHKGSIEGIEMILSLFGLRSKRWYDKKLINKDNQRIFSPYKISGCTFNDEDYDYTIDEYVAFASPLKETIREDGEYTIDWYNQTKTIAYDTDDYRNGIYNEYQGLPVKYYDETTSNGENTRYLVPYFDKDAIIDGNPYFQMNGGWFCETNPFNKSTLLEYKETIKNILSVNDLKELLSIPYNSLTNGTIYQVRDLSENYIIIDGIIYNIYYEYNNDNTYEYFNATVYNNGVKVGSQLYLDSIFVYSPYGSGDVVKEELYYLSNYNNGDNIRIYIDKNNNCYIRESYVDDITPLNTTIFKNKKIINNNVNNLTNYFQITNKNYKNKLVIDGDGWKQLDENNEDLKKACSIKNYFNGNNPHIGNNKYDNGAEYLSYFKQLFKYAIENEEFNPKYYYGTTMESILNKLKSIGFNMIDEINIDKLDYIGDYYQIDEIKNKKIQTKFKYTNNKPSNNTEYNITSPSSKKWSVASKYFIDDKGYPEQIVNIKKIKINFKINKSEIYYKYINEIVIKYLSQMIPHNTIVSVSYS